MTVNSKTDRSSQFDSDTGVRSAFLDVDGTLIRGDSQALEARYRLTRRRPGRRRLGSVLMTLADHARAGRWPLCRFE